MKKTSYRIISFVIMITFFSCLISHAWLSSKWDSTDSHTISFKSGDVESPRLTIWTCDISGEEPEWIVYYTDVDEENVSEMRTIDTVVESEGKLTEVDGRLQFGMITSLVEATDENDIYMRFDIDGTKYNAQHYDFMALDYHYQASYVDVYEQDNDNARVNDDALYAKLAANDLVSEYYVASAEKYDNVPDIEALFEGEPDALSDDSAVEKVDVQDGDFCIYLKLTLNRENLREVLADLNKYMPCYLVFNIYIGIEPQKELA